MIGVFRIAIAGAAVVACAVTGSTFVCAGELGSDPKPQRIVSTNLCTDQLVLLLADRERLASVTSRAVDPDVSNVVALAQGLTLNEGRAEEILVLKPDLVVTDHYWNRRTSGLMEKLGVRVHGIDWADSLAQIKAVIRDVAGAIGEPGRGEAMVAELEARLSAVAENAKAREFASRSNNHLRAERIYLGRRQSRGRADASGRPRKSLGDRGLWNGRHHFDRGDRNAEAGLAAGEHA